MKKIIGVFSLAMMLGVVGVAVAAFDPPEPPGDDGKKVTICHIPPGNSENPRTIEISVNAVDAHLEHGDTVGECA